MLLTLIFVLLVLWAIGMLIEASGIIHILIVIVLVLFIIRLIQGARVF